MPTKMCIISSDILYILSGVCFFPTQEMCENCFSTPGGPRFTISLKIRTEKVGITFSADLSGVGEWLNWPSFKTEVNEVYIRYDVLWK